MEVFEEAAKRGVIIINITQCARGTVSASYAPGRVSVSASYNFLNLRAKTYNFTVWGPITPVIYSTIAIA